MVWTRSERPSAVARRPGAAGHRREGRGKPVPRPVPFCWTSLRAVLSRGERCTVHVLLHVIAGSEDGTVRLWDLLSGEQRGELPTGSGERVRGLVFSPDGRSLAATNRDGEATSWDPASGRRRSVPLTSRTSEVVSPTCGPDGKTVASGHQDSTVGLRTTARPGTAESIDQICRALRRDFTQEERSRYLRGMRTDPVCPR
ncbi:WD40 repeat domain-containing protein [Streptomyces sp. NPDC102283]|uniref:WD40 repeat domain-containing protein n=1 Tax=Streptomyces sp. NPDC102283 TaxID=3366155 RepID=UPI003819EFB8